MKFKIISLLTFVMGFGLLTNSIISQEKTKEPSTIIEPKSFVIHYIVSKSKNNILKTSEYRVRAVSSTGNWKETRYSFTGKVVTLGSTQGDFFIVDDKAKHFYGKNNPDAINTAMRSEESLKTNPDYVRIEELAGLKGYVLRKNAGYYEIENTFSPQTGITPLKTVIFEAANQKTILITEALNVEFRDLSESELQLPNLPVQFDYIELKIQALKAAGQPEFAENLQQAVNNMKTMKK